MDTDSFLIKLSESERTDFGRVDFEQQCPEQRIFSAIWALESQVNNGGFAQYISSHNGDTASAAPWALREIGALRCADIVTRALKTASPTGVMPASREGREALVDSLSSQARKKLEALDNEFFSYPDNLTDLLYMYISKHPSVFGAV